MPWLETRREPLAGTTTVRRDQRGQPYAFMRVRVWEAHAETGETRAREVDSRSTIRQGVQAAELGVTLALEVGALALREIEAALLVMEAKKG